MLSLFIVAAVLAAIFMLVRGWSLRHRALARLREHAEAKGTALPGHLAEDGALQRWLSRAGYRGPKATTYFVVATALSTAIGLAAAQFYRLVLLRPLIQMVANAPGSTADVLAAILLGGPWILLLLGATAPLMLVRNARRSRVQAIEQDLPLALELFATMADAGLGFDAALSKIVRTRGSDRPLIAELVNFQVDTLAGMPRIHALRQLGRRVDIPALTRFTSALIHAEQAGASMAETLQHQADDLRQRRREDALVHAQALPVKLVFPLVICFLPGIFASTLAPVIYQIIQVADSVLRSTGR